MDVAEIRVNDIELESTLSPPGSQNTVWRATYSLPFSQRTVTVKNCAKFKREEALILQQLRHPNIIEFLGVTQLDSAGYAIVTEYAEKGSLSALMKQHRDDWSDFRKHRWIKWAVEMARGLQYIHKQNHQHGNAKSSNMVIAKKGETLKLCDFATAKHSEATVSTGATDNQGGPEVTDDPQSNQGIGDIQSQIRVTPRSDVFFYAVVVWELFTGKELYPGKSASQVFNGVQRQRPNIPTECPETLRKLLTECWDHDHTKRPSMDEILSNIEPELFPKEKRWFSETFLKLHNVSSRGASRESSTEIWQGTLSNRLPVAIKLWKENFVIPLELLEEARVMMKLRHPNICELLGVSIEKQMYIVTEWMSSGNLADYLPVCKQELPHLLTIAAQIARGMDYLGSCGYIHRDLRAKNVLIGEKHQVKIAGFKKTIQCGEKAELDEEIDVRWTAPEAIEHCQFSIKSDVWSFGILLSEIVTFGRSPYFGMSNTEVVHQVTRGPWLSKSPKCPDDLWELMLHCWKIHPADRYTFEFLSYYLPDMEGPKRALAKQKKVFKEPKEYVALCNYVAQNGLELSLLKGEMLELMDKKNNMWLVKSTRTGRTGRVPRNCIGHDRKNHREECYFGCISRTEAEEKLQQPGIEPGTFIVRDNDSDPGTLALAIRNKPDSGTHVSHRRIHCDNIGYFGGAAFPTLAAKIKHHQQEAGERKIQLTNPCPREFPKTVSSADWIIPRECLKLKKMIAVSQHGQVWTGTLKMNGRIPVAVKSCSKVGSTSTAYLAEASVMKQLRHSNLCQLYGIWHKVSRESKGTVASQEPFWVAEWMCNGNLLNYLQHGKGRNLEMPQLVDIAIQIASGMSYLESRNYVHRKLAARNVLMRSGTNIVKVADFWEEQMTENSHRSPEFLLSCKWTAPEAILRGSFSTKSDVWSFGILLTELVTHGQTPYSGVEVGYDVHLIELGCRMPKMVNCPDDLYGAMVKCWDKDPASRPTFEFLLSFLEMFNHRLQGHP